MSLESRPAGWRAPWKTAIASAIPGAVAVVFLLPIAFNLSGALTPFLAEGSGSMELYNTLHMLRHVLAMGLYGLLTPAVSWRMTDHSVVAAGAITGRQQQTLRLLSVAMVGLYILEFVVQVGWVAPSSKLLAGLGTGLPILFYGCGLLVLDRIFQHLGQPRMRVPLVIIAVLYGLMILVRLLLMQAALEMPGIFGETELTWGGFFAAVVEVGVLGTAVGGLSSWVLLRLKRVCGG